MINFETCAPLSQLFLELEKLSQTDALITEIAMRSRAVPPDLAELNLETISAAFPARRTKRTGIRPAR